MDSRIIGTHNVPHCGSGVLTEPPYLEKAPHGSYHTGLLKVGVRIGLRKQGFGYNSRKSLATARTAWVRIGLRKKGFGYTEDLCLTTEIFRRADRLKETRLWVLHLLKVNYGYTSVWIGLRKKDFGYDSRGNKIFLEVRIGLRKKGFGYAPDSAHFKPQPGVRIGLRKKGFGYILIPVIYNLLWSWRADRLKEKRLWVLLID